MAQTPKQIVTPHKRIPLTIPNGMSPVEFFNSPANLMNLAQENGLLRSPEDFLVYRKLIGHSLEFDTSIILDTSKKVLDPLGRPVRRDQLSDIQKKVWSRMTQIVLEYMLDHYPDPQRAVVLCGEASLDATWPLSKSGVPSIRMIHNHFIVFTREQLREAREADPDDPNLSDSGHHSLFLRHLSDVYHRFLEILKLGVLKPISTDESRIGFTGYPEGLPSWEVTGGAESLKSLRFWEEYDLILKGFLDFYRTFFGQVASRNAPVPADAYFPDQVEDVLLFNNDFHRVAREIRDRVLADPQFANDIRWRPAYKQILYRDDKGRLIVTISQNSVGNAITELLGIVVRRAEDEAAYLAAEPALIEKLLDVRERLRAADLGEPIDGPSWRGREYLPPSVH
ncbi:MAG: hypothetical protein QNJ87_09325 [Gammaproteobacteria bacterium]|nr:hypothetical protein [Gammaproteobacteria bacterium]MDJ0871960.1 hypothetical protein [Gammaproteobacteria bacterium]MDJ0891196.1 hypothetical protein [Gammaproteobacteria bacterium]